MNKLSATKLTKQIVEKFIPSRENNSRKGDNGKILIVGGSYIYHGAPALSSLAALRSGSDLVYTCVPKINAFSTRSISPDLIVIPMADSKLTRGTVNKMLGQVPVDIDSTAIGMGLAIQDVEAIKLLVKSLLDRNVRISLDASSLVKEILPIIEGQNVVVTPHSGEFKRIFGDSIDNEINARIVSCEKFAKKTFNNNITKRTRRYNHKWRYHVHKSNINSVYDCWWYRRYTIWFNCWISF